MVGRTIHASEMFSQSLALSKQCDGWYYSGAEQTMSHDIQTPLLQVAGSSVWWELESPLVSASFPRSCPQDWGSLFQVLVWGRQPCLGPQWEGYCDIDGVWLPDALLPAPPSPAMGIPDFRSPSTGLYANLQKYQLPYPEAIFETGYFKVGALPGRNACNDGSWRWGHLLSSHQRHLSAHLPSALSPTETSRALLCPRQGTLSCAIQGELFFAGTTEKVKGQQAWDIEPISYSHKYMGSGAQTA